MTQVTQFQSPLVPSSIPIFSLSKSPFLLVKSLCCLNPNCCYYDPLFFAVEILIFFCLNPFFCWLNPNCLMVECQIPIFDGSNPIFESPFFLGEMPSVSRQEISSRASSRTSCGSRGPQVRIRQLVDIFLNKTYGNNREIREL